MSGYRPQAEDTSEGIDRFVFDRLRALTPGERLALAGQASAALEGLMIAGLRLRHPEASEADLRLRAGALRLGRELCVRAFGQRAEAWFP